MGEIISGAAPSAYIPNSGNNTVSVIDTATNKVTATVLVEILLLEFLSHRMEKRYMW